MEQKIKWRLSVKRSLCLLLALIALVTVFNPVTSEAKTKYKTRTSKVTISKGAKYTSKMAESKAKTIKFKNGYYNIYKVTVKNNGRMSYEGYIRFKAPKTKTYIVNYNHLTAMYDSKVYGNISVQVPKNKKWMFNITPLGEWNSYVKLSNDPKRVGYETSRTICYNLKKGQYAYMHFFFSSSSYPGEKVKFNIIIK